MHKEDLILAGEIARGDQDAFTYMYNRYYNQIKYYVSGIIKSHFDSEDIAQEVFLRAYQSMGTYTGAASLNRWLRTIATNLCIDKMRKRQLPVTSWPAISGDREDILVDFPDANLLPHEQAEVEDNVNTILDAMLCLPEHYRDVVLLHDVMHYTREEIAQKLSRPIGTIKSRLSRGHNILSRLLASEYIKSPHYSPAGSNINDGEMVAS